MTGVILVVMEIMHGHSSAAYAVESFDDSGTKKFLLAIKSTDTWEGQQNISGKLM